jgi:alkylhydroperoxidase family enzyme
LNLVRLHESRRGKAGIFLPIQRRCNPARYGMKWRQRGLRAVLAQSARFDPGKGRVIARKVRNALKCAPCNRQDLGLTLLILDVLQVARAAETGNPVRSRSGPAAVIPA